MKFCNYCHKLIPQGYDLWWNQKPYHPDCAIQVAVTDTQRKEAMDTICAYCNERILAGCREMWRGKNYHDICMAKAIQESYEPPKQELQDQFVDEDDVFDPDYREYRVEDYEDDEFNVSEEFDDLDSPENGHIEVMPPEHPETLPRPEIHINEVVAQATQAFVADRTNGTATIPKAGTLMLGTKGSRYVTRTDLYDLETPTATSTWRPVPHYDFVRRLLDGLWDRRMIVTDEKYAVSNDGYKLYGLLTLQDEYDGVNYAIGLKNSNDKSTRLSLAVGYVVKVCTNGMINGDYQPLTAKHTARFNLEDSLSIGIDRIKRSFLRLNGSIERKRDFQLTEGQAQEFVYKAFMKHKLPISLLNTVHKELFIAPSYEEFKPLNLWSLENAMTTAFKKLQPTSQFEAMSKLAKFLDTCLN